MKFLVTGGAGFIGSALIRHIVANTSDFVVNIDKLTYAGNLDNLQSVERSDRYLFEKVDICNTRAVEKIFDYHQPDAVLHLAAESHVDRSIEGPSAFIETNILGTYNLLEVSRSYWKSLSSDRNFRFHHISTDEVYGDLIHPDQDSSASENLFTEETSYNPSSPYSASKASSDHLVRAWNRTYGLPTLITNCSNNYGPYHFPEKLIPHVILNALQGKELPVYGKGQQIRDWLYVEDHARALYMVATDGEIGETYNIGGHNEKRNLDVVRELCSILDDLLPPHQNSSLISRSTEIKSYAELITFVPDRPGHDQRYAIDSTKIERELGWRPVETFESGLRKTVEWYLENSQWWTRVLNGDYQLSRLGRMEKGE